MNVNVRKAAQFIQGLLATALFGVGGSASGAGQPLAELTRASQVRQLKPEQAELNYPVRLRGVVTFYEESLFSRFIQDETAGIYFRESSNTPPLTAGQVVEIEGSTSPGEYAPIIVPTQIRVLGDGSLPVAEPVSFEQLASGQEDSQFVEVVGIIHSVRRLENSPWHLIDLATGGGRLSAYARDLPLASTDELVDSTVRIRGVCSTLFNRQRQLFDIRLMVPRTTDLVVEKPAPADPFAVATQSIGSLLQFTPQGTYGHRVKVAGTVTCQQPGRDLFIQDGPHGLQVYTMQNLMLQVGDQVEVLGFPAKGQYTPVLQDAIYRKVTSGAAPAPTPITADQALKGTHDCRLVQLEAMLLDHPRSSRDEFLVLQAGGILFHAYSQPPPGKAAFPNLEKNSRLSITGVCLIEAGSDWRAGEEWRAKSFRIILRSPADVTLLQAPPWWTLKKLLWTVGALTLVVLGAFGWVGILRRRVHAQTRIIRQQLKAEAALKERYVDLFENANDVVYTHDLAGRLTSINQAGERLLQASRQQILSKNIVDLVIPEQRAAAQNWLQQVLQGIASHTVEWDFPTPSGQPRKVEISARLIEQHGCPLEVEGIARDITERKRLECELLEISNREQRRIGHDLHDGVCQQLVGIAYLNETLSDRLNERGASESAEAQRIGDLLNTAINQTRGVARGLFPARLEESGLVSALEELAAHTSELFNVQCRFCSEHAPESLDSTVALHLFYIAQEAVANAVKHGKARKVCIGLEPVNDGWELSVIDNGLGFVPVTNGQPGMGLRIMHYRARVIGATLEVKTQPGAGTQLTCVLQPLGPKGTAPSTLALS